MPAGFQLDCTTKSLGGSFFSFLLPCLINAVTEQENRCPKVVGQMSDDVTYSELRPDWRLLLVAAAALLFIGLALCVPGVEGYSAGWIAGGSSFLISLQMKSSISMSER